jgi:hypothetical protein
MSPLLSMSAQPPSCLFFLSVNLCCMPAFRSVSSERQAVLPAWGPLFGSPLRSHGNVDSAPALGVELDRPLDHGEDRVIPADADAHARVPLGAALAHEDVAGDDALTAEPLNAEVLGMGVAAVPGRAACLFVCYPRSSRVLERRLKRRRCF